MGSRILLLTLVIWTLPVLGQDPIPVKFDEELDFDRPEAWTYAYFTSVSMVSPLGVPDVTTPGAIALGLSGSNVPNLGLEKRTVGFNGSKVEDLNKSNIFGRLRLDVGLPAQLTLTIGYVPPIELDGARPRFFSLSLGRPVWRHRRGRLAVRIHGQKGRIKGDFTCSRQTVAAGPDPVLNPFLCTQPSNDSLRTSYVAAEVSHAFETPGDRFEPYVAAALNYMDLHFNVHAIYSGVLDTSELDTDGWTWSAAAGTKIRIGSHLDAFAEAFYTPLDVIRPPATTSRNDALLNARVMLRYHW